MRKIYVVLILTGLFVFQYCSSSKKAAKQAAAHPSVTYAANIQQVVATSCSPCHIAGKGNKKSLDNYTAASSNIDDILSRIQRNPGEKGFMPAMHPKLDDATINL